VHEGRTQTVRRDALVVAGQAPSDMPAFQPDWRKSTVRNDRGDDGNVSIIRSLVEHAEVSRTYHISQRKRETEVVYTRRAIASPESNWLVTQLTHGRWSARCYTRNAIQKVSFLRVRLAEK